MNTSTARTAAANVKARLQRMTKREGKLNLGDRVTVLAEYDTGAVYGYGVLVGVIHSILADPFALDESTAQLVAYVVADGGGFSVYAPAEFLRHYEG